MSIRTEATIEDLYRVPGKAELVDGEIVHMSPTSYDHGYAALEIALSLREYCRRTGTGHHCGDNVGFVVNLPRRKSFSPDAAFFTQATVARKFVNGAPLFAAEVRSEDDYGPAGEHAMAAKRADYFAAGTQIVWDVDLDSDDVVRVFRAGVVEPSIYRRGESANAEPALPGWTMPVDDLFPPATPGSSK